MTSGEQFQLSISGQAIVSHAPNSPKHEFYTFYCSEYELCGKQACGRNQKFLIYSHTDNNDKIFINAIFRLCTLLLKSEQIIGHFSFLTLFSIFKVYTQYT